jgi:hypothetical protein
MSFRNLAIWDQFLHVVIGAAMLVLGWSGMFGGYWAAALKIFGVFPLAAGLIGWDPLYAFLHLSTGRR